MQPFEFQPHLAGKNLSLRPLLQEDFEALYAVARDPLIWEQHPQSDRYEPDVFKKFFEKALTRPGALLVLSDQDEVIGSSRFYDFNAVEKSVAIGYTFLSRDHWGAGTNQELKRVMINHAFRWVDHVQFHIGETNFRSIRAVEKIGGRFKEKGMHDGNWRLVFEIAKKS